MECIYQFHWINVLDINWIYISMPFLNEMMYAHHFVIFLLFKKKSFNKKGSRLAALLHVDKKYLSWHKWRVSYVTCSYMPININTCRTFQGMETWYGFRQNTTFIKSWWNLWHDLLIGRFLKYFTYTRQYFSICSYQ